jgi:gliding motility associated protien GldN
MKALSSAFFVLFFFISFGIYAQSYNPPQEGVNENSLRPVHPSDIMFRKGIWRRIDLREKQNKGFFSDQNQISKIIVDAVKRGDVKPYLNDSLTTRISIEQFTEKLQLPNTGGGGDDAGLGDEFGGGFGDEGDKKEEVVTSNEFFAKDIVLMDLREDLVFDKQRSRMYFDIQAVGLIIPGDNPALLAAGGVDREICWVSYKELVMNVFSKDKTAIWYNRQNSAEHRSLTDAFELRLFGSKIYKVSNPDNKRIEDIYGADKTGILATYWKEAELMEYEHNLWEY